MRISFAVLLILALSGCGFQLRGNVDLPQALQTLQVVSIEENSDMLREVTRLLRSNGITVTEERASYRLGLGRETAIERTLSVNANARAGEYELELGILFQLNQGGNLVLGPEPLRVTRVYLSDPENAVAKNEEAELIREEMRRELALQLLRRLQSAEL